MDYFNCLEHFIWIFLHQSSNDIFKATMPKNKFRFILKFIQLDNKTSCHKRWKRDKFGAIWILYEEVNVQNAKNKTSSTYTSIDERLYLYCGKKKIKQNPSKPAKYGLFYRSYVMCK